MFSMPLLITGNLLPNYQLRLVIPAPPRFPDEIYADSSYEEGT
jgi:hypothetical protein